jgi:PadR family transcriptional regulator, regulatory protein PadR
MADQLDAQGLARSCNELLILAVLSGEPKHGYQIALELEERSEGYFGFNHGTLYPILHQLEKEGFIDGRWSEGEGRRKKEYAITAAGRRHYAGRVDEWRALYRRLFALVGAAGGDA